MSVILPFHRRWGQVFLLLSELVWLGLVVRQRGLRRYCYLWSGVAGVLLSGLAAVEG